LIRKTHSLIFLHCCLVIVFVIAAPSKAYSGDEAQENFRQAYHVITEMLEGHQPVSFKRAVFEVENAYLDGQLDRALFQQELDLLTELVLQTMYNRELQYSRQDKRQVEIHAAMFTVMNDTTTILFDENVSLVHLPFRYDFDDVFGRDSWQQMFVSKLLATRTGNCHSLPYLYKILAEELGVQAHLALAPNHVYIKLRNQQSGWYNVELTSRQFPVDAWLTASGYVHLDAIRSGIYMDTVSTKQSLALTLVDLAKGYERKMGGADPEFVLEIIEGALNYDPKSINALLLKAETLNKMIQSKSKQLGSSKISEAERHSALQSLFEQMQRTYANIHESGYRQMPESMYLAWLESLQAEAEKFENKNLPYFQD